MDDDNQILDTKPLSSEVTAQIAAVADQYRSANTLLMKAINYGASKAENTLKILPPATQEKFEVLVAAGLTKAYEAANWTQPSSDSLLHTALKRVAGEKAHRTVASVSGAIGGVAGLLTTTAEIPVTVALILRSIQNIAMEYGEDLNTEETRIECIKVFGSGSPLIDDDGVDIGFFGARVTLTGQAVQNVISSVAPKLGAVLGQKLATQAVPVIGAVTGAGINYTFMTYYQQMAHVRFRLRQIARENDMQLVLEAFKAAVDE